MEELDNTRTIERTNDEIMDAQTSSVKRPNTVLEDVNNSESVRRRLNTSSEENTHTTGESTTSGEIGSVQQRPSEVEDEDIPFIIELGDKAVRDKFHNDRGAFLQVLSKSPFAHRHSGKPNFHVTKKRVVLNILKKEYSPELLNIKQLVYNGESWPIECKLATKEPQFKYGVIKIHPEVSEESIKSDLLRNGVKIDEVFRIKNAAGPTYSVRLSFKDNIVPEKVTWGGEELFVSSYFPGVLICNKCSKGGHIAKYCRTNLRDFKCPLCAGEHIKFECKLYKDNDRDPEKRKCANCGEAGHGAIDKVCPYFINEKKIIAVMSKFGIQRYEAKKLVKEIDIDIERYKNLQRSESQAEIRSMRDIVERNHEVEVNDLFSNFNSNVRNQEMKLKNLVTKALLVRTKILVKTIILVIHSKEISPQ